ncbi:MAG: hypothetical protein AB3N14_13370 [Flavobacteriaceae bacterium]
MLKIISISLSFLILLQSFNISIGEIVEIDELIEHAQFHSEEYGDNFLVFLSKHYGELKSEHSKKHQEERKDHEKLPFQHQLHGTSLSAFVIEKLDLSLNPCFIIPITDNYYYQDSHSFLLEKDLFQPPRRA